MFSISGVEGNRQNLDGGSMFGNAPRPVWERWAKPDAVGRIELACRSLLIEGEGKRVLCETGIGAFFEPKLAERYGVQNANEHRLLLNLKRLGVLPEQIDFVILSHLHFDHAGGLLPTYAEMAAGERDFVFPNASIVVGREAWERALQPHSRDRASFVPGLTDQLKSCGKLVIVEKNHVPGLWEDRLSFVTTSGHTPGQLHTLFRGDRDSVFFAGDLVPGTAWVHLPITMGYDRFPELVIDEKNKIYSQLTAQNSWLFYTHDVRYAVSKIVRDSTGKFVPVQETEQLERVVI